MSTPKVSFIVSVYRRASRLKSKKQRRKQGLILLEGFRLITDALDSGVQPLRIYYDRIASLQTLDKWSLDEKVLEKVSGQRLKMLADTVQPQGLVGVFQVINWQTDQDQTRPTKFLEIWLHVLGGRGYMPRGDQLEQLEANGNGRMRENMISRKFQAGSIT